MSERRTEKRLNACLEASWEGESGNYDARVTDLSEGGCYVDSLTSADVGEVVLFRLQMPDGEWLELSGEVAHETRTVGFGLRFVSLSEDQRQKLQVLLDHLNSSPTSPSL